MRFILTISVVIFFLKSFGQPQKPSTDWLFVYYMPYDNNLSRFGDLIIKMIGDSITSHNVMATVQADYNDFLGMKRYVITNESIVMSEIDNDQSALTQSYEDYLKWSLEQASYKRLAIIFLDHGGKLDELCLDEKPTNGFLKVDSLKETFSRVLGKEKIDLLFLQVCTKGSIEPLYEFKEASDYTLCSQITLGAPNYYYHGLFSALSNNEDLNAIEVANEIVQSEASNMYNSYTLIDNKKLDSCFILLENFVHKLEKITATGLSTEPLSTFYFGEWYWDLLSVLKQIKIEEFSALDIERKTLIDFISNELIVFHQPNPERKGMEKFSGLSMSAYSSGKQYDNLEFYRLLGFLRKALARQ